MTPAEGVWRVLFTVALGISVGWIIHWYFGRER